MNLLKKAGLVAAGSAMTVIGVIGAGAIFAQDPATGTATPPAITTEVPADSVVPSTEPIMPSTGGHGGRHGFMGDGQQALADALGITVEELQAAVEQARTTMSESDTDGDGRPDRDAHEQALADALGITVDELDAAEESARQSAIDQAVADGTITEEQAATMRAHNALKEYIDHEAIMQSVLGMTHDEVEAAEDAGQSLDDILASKGYDRETFQAAIQTKVQEAVQQAVTDGVITQEQADQLNQESGFFGGFGRGGHGPRGGHGHDGMGPDGDWDGPDGTTPDSTPTDSTSTDTSL